MAFSSISARSLSICMLFFFAPSASAQLSPAFYNASCPNALPLIRSAVNAAVRRDARMAASLLRLHFHDCFVQGCDGSLLLDDTSTFTGEKTANPNSNSLRGFEVIDAIKSRLETACKQVVSCADIVAVVALGGPSWEVELGRRDSTTASLSSANTDLPGSLFDLAALTSSFARKGLSTADMVALSGAHTVGLARCKFFRARIYNDTNIAPSLASSLQSNCSSTSGGEDSALSPFDAQTPTVFDNKYYTDLTQMKGLLRSDQALYDGGPVDSQVASYADDSAEFFGDFASGMVRMGRIGPLTGSSGEIRINCRKVN